MSSAIDYVIDPATGRRNVGCRRLSLRNRYECGTNVTAPSDLKRIYTACVARGQKLPVTFTVGAHPLDFFAATTRQPGDELELVANFRGEPAPVVKSLTNDILVPADAEMTLEGYLDERGYVEPEGPYGEYMGYYGAIHMDPVFHCTAITMRADVLHHTLLHGSAFLLDQTDSANISSMRVEADAMKILKATVREPVAVYLRSVSGGANTLRVSIKQRSYGEAKQAIAALFGGIMRLKHVYVFDEDIDIHDERQVDWAMGTRFQADQDMVILQGMLGMTMDPSLNGRRTGAKSGFDCTKPFGRDGQIPLTRCASRVFKGPARYQNVEQALSASPMFYADIVESLGSDDGREVACALDELRQAGKLGRDRDGRYHLQAAQARHRPASSASFITTRTKGRELYSFSPACGEKVGMRGRRRHARNRGKAPSPAALRADDLSPRAGRGKAALQSPSCSGRLLAILTSQEHQGAKHDEGAKPLSERGCIVRGRFAGRCAGAGTERGTGSKVMTSAAW